jgi:hypothetical protein
MYALFLFLGKSVWGRAGQLKLDIKFLHHMFHCLMFNKLELGFNT